MDDSFRSNPRPEEDLEPTDELETSDADEGSQMKPPEPLRVSVRTVPGFGGHHAQSFALTQTSLSANGYCISSKTL
jgi:hypothetical protein